MVDFKRELFGLRLRYRFRNLPFGARQADEALAADIADLAYGQIKHWTLKNPGKAFLNENLSRINQTHPSIFIFEIPDNKVIVQHKQKLVLPPELDKLYPGFMEDLRAGAEYYKKNSSPTANRR